MTPTATPTTSLMSEALQQIAAIRRFFERTTGGLEEKHSGFRATPETRTVAGQVAHVAQTIDWFREGGLEDRWRLDFETMMAETDRVTSLAAARAWLEEAWNRLEAAVRALPETRLEEPMAPNPILQERRRYGAIEAITDHTAHHRGSLAVCVRLLGEVPPMPYGDD
ncbi:MAG: DinB family protein [Thermoanaerobaculia bacterium]|nr:MAG: DinB family protein [Thermoanaerobaculia bacterium]